MSSPSPTKTITFVWDGNNPIHEIHNEDITTWVFNDGFVPVAKITNDNHYSIITDYLGTPVEAYNSEGDKVWSVELDIYGRVMTDRNHVPKGDVDFIPFRYQGQYHDIETGLYYNRFRYYDPTSGNCTQQDPIGLTGGNPTLYGYVGDANWWIDPFGLNVSTGANRAHVTYRGTKGGLPYTGYASAPLDRNLTANEIIAYRYGDDFSLFGGVAPVAVYFGIGVTGKNTARGLEQHYYEKDVEAAKGDKTKVANQQNPVGENNKKKKRYKNAADMYLKEKPGGDSNTPVSCNP